MAVSSPPAARDCQGESLQQAVLQEAGAVLLAELLGAAGYIQAK